MKRAATRHDVEKGENLHHVTCGSRVEYWDPDDTGDRYIKCPQCGVLADVDYVAQLSPSTIARFYFVLEPDCDVLVEDQIDGKRFLRTVPASEAHRYDRAKVDLG